MSNKVNRVIAACKARIPEQCDRVFDALAPGGIENFDLMAEVIEGLKPDPDSLAWLCGYVSSEINRQGDLPGTITNLSRKLIDSGYFPMEHFMPYPGKRIVFIQPDIFKEMPLSLKLEVFKVCDTFEQDGKEFERDLEAQLSEWKS